MLALLALAAAALLVAIVGLSTEKGGDPKFKIDGIGDAQRIFSGLEQEGDRLGSDDAPVELVFFCDIQSPSCAEHFLAVAEPLVEDLVRDDEVKLDYRHYSFSARVEQLGFFAAEAAGEQGYQWHYIYLFFRNQDDAEANGVSDRLLETLAGSIAALDVPKWRDDLAAALEDGSDVGADLADSEEFARQLGVRAEPALLVAGPEDRRLLQDSPSLEQIIEAIEAVR